MSPNAGWSTTWVLSALRDNRSGGQLWSFDLQDTSTKLVPKALARGCWHFVKGDARQTVYSAPDFDYLFIDSDHSRGFAEWYTEALFPRIRPGTIVSVHDVFHSAEPSDEGVVVLNWLRARGLSYWTPSCAADGATSAQVRQERARLGIAYVVHPLSEKNPCCFLRPDRMAEPRFAQETEIGEPVDRFWPGLAFHEPSVRSHPKGPVIDVGCGAHKQLGTIGVDRRRLLGVDVVCNFERGLPFRDGSIAAAYSIHSIEHMRDLITFMEELYRVCAPGAKVYVKTPYYASRKAFVDPTHVRFMTEESFGYFQSPNYYGLKTNFRLVSINYNMRKPFKFLPAYFQKRCRRYLWNVCEEMTVVLEAVKP